MFNFLLEILPSHLFLMSQNLERRVTNGVESNKLNLILQIRGIVEQNLRLLFITSIFLEAGHPDARQLISGHPDALSSKLLSPLFFFLF